MAATSAITSSDMPVRASLASTTPPQANAATRLDAGSPGSARRVMS
jgi:hypothetical protein